MVMERGLDSGPVIATRSIPIAPDDTTETLTVKLADLGAALLTEEIGGYLSGTTSPVQQPEAGVTLARPMRKSDGEIDWTKPAAVVERHIRAMWPWPRAWSRSGELTVQIHSARSSDVAFAVRPGPGTVSIVAGEAIVACGQGAVHLETVQFPGKTAVPARAAVARGQLTAGMCLERAPADREPLVTVPTIDSATSA